MDWETERHYTIGRAAAAAGVGVETIRFYERKGLIERPAKPTSGGYRQYPQSSVDRIRLIRELKGLGFSLAEIRDLTAARPDGGLACGATHESLAGKRREVAAQIAELDEAARCLDVLLERCPTKGKLDDNDILRILAEQKRNRR